VVQNEAYDDIDGTYFSEGCKSKSHRPDSKLVRTHDVEFSAVAGHPLLVERVKFSERKVRSVKSRKRHHLHGERSRLRHM
jgi:hypothetical protein